VGAAAVSILVNAGYRRTALRLERARYRLRRAAELDPLTGLVQPARVLGAGRADPGRRRLQGHPVRRDDRRHRPDEGDQRPVRSCRGDAAIIDAATLLQRVLRSDDPIARLGGDEFCALLTSTADPVSVRERIMELLGEVKQTRLHPLSLSVGFAGYDPTEPCTIDELLQRGDIAMYEHKRARSSRSEPVRR
jgi:GGDEF domain-containing protein